VAAAVAVVITALLCVWTIWQPEASERASNNALDLIDSHKLVQARDEARTAHDANPLSPRPFIVGASVEEAAGNNRAALATLEQAALEFPGDPQTWLRLSGFQLNTLDQPDKALQTLGAALYLDPHSKLGRALFLQARHRSREQHVAALALKKRQAAAAAKKNKGRKRR
jgi:tetratricopeptide (TPR) repeat protein